MDMLEQHEQFEIEVLDALHRASILDRLVFGGGTMLRLCHELNRYSVDLDFWFLKPVEQDAFFERMQKILWKSYELTDSQIKHYSLIFEMRSADYPKRLKIEIRRQLHDFDFETKIAFSKFSTRQVLVRAHTLDQTMKNKVAAFLSRAEIRDCFDIEFLLRRGIRLPQLDEASLADFKAKLNRFKHSDFKVKLGSIVEGDIRRYYNSQGFAFLKEKLRGVISE